MSELTTPDPVADPAANGVPSLPVDVARHHGRALIGWMSEDAAAVALAGSSTPTLAQVQQAARARDAAASRLHELDQSGIVSPATPELLSYAEELKAAGTASAFFTEGWSVNLVDLRFVCAFQPQVDVESAANRVALVDDADVVGIAAVTLPTDPPAPVPMGFNSSTNVWSCASPNHNLRILGNFSGPLAEAGNVPGFGFAVATMPSFVQVAMFNGRYYLRDGYHRAVGLLARGVNVVAAFVKALDSIESMVPNPAGMLPQAAYLGARPPTLADYLDDSVAADVAIPIVHKVVLVHATETVVVAA